MYCIHSLLFFSKLFTQTCPPIPSNVFVDAHPSLPVETMEEAYPPILTARNYLMMYSRDSQWNQAV